MGVESKTNQPIGMFNVTYMKLSGNLVID